MKLAISVTIWLQVLLWTGCAGEFLKSDDKSQAANAGADSGQVEINNSPNADMPRRPLEEAEDLGYLTYPTNDEIEFKVAGTTFIIPQGSIVGTDWVSIAIGGTPGKLKVEFFWPMTRDHLATVNLAGSIVMVYLVDHAMTTPVARITPFNLPEQAAFELPGTFDPATNSVRVEVPQQKVQPSMEVELQDRG